MGCLIVTVIAAVLGWFDIISVKAGLLIIFGSLAWMFIAPVLYFKFGAMKFFYHDLLHWHNPDGSSKWHDGCSMHCVCKHCGRNIMQDSQGNWFTFD